MLESAYEACLAFELLDRGSQLERQKALPLDLPGPDVSTADIESTCWSRTLVVVEVKVDRASRAGAQRAGAVVPAAVEAAKLAC